MSQFSLPLKVIVGLFSVALLICMSWTAWIWINRPIPQPGITGGKVIRWNPDGSQTEYTLAGIADKSGVILVATTGEEFWLDGSEKLKVIYTSGREKTFGQRSDTTKK